MESLVGDSSSLNPRSKDDDNRYSDILAAEWVQTHSEWKEIGKILKSQIKKLEKEADLAFSTMNDVELEVNDFTSIVVQSEITTNVLHAFFRLLRGNYPSYIFGSVFHVSSILENINPNIQQTFHLANKPHIANLRAFLPFKSTQGHFVLLIVILDSKHFTFYDSHGLDFELYFNTDINKILGWLEKNLEVRPGSWKVVAPRFSQVEKYKPMVQSGINVIRSTLREIHFNNHFASVCQEDWNIVRCRVLADLMGWKHHDPEKPI